MANNNIINTGKATQGQFVVSYQESGNGAAIPVINGVPEQRLMFGYVSESDRRGCLNLIEEALKATEGDIPAAMRYMYNAALTAAKEIKADEAVEVNGYEIIISYAAKKAYLHTQEVADLEDITTELPEEAVKAMLVDRVRLYLERKEAEEERRYRNSYENPEWREYWGMDDEDDYEDEEEPEDDPEYYELFD